MNMKIRRFRQLAIMMASVLTVSTISANLTAVSALALEEEAVVQEVQQEEPAPAEVVQEEVQAEAGNSESEVVSEAAGETAAAVAAEVSEEVPAEVPADPAAASATETPAEGDGTIAGETAEAVVITFEAAEGGSLIPDGQEATNRFVQTPAAQEEIASVRAAASDGYEFAGWSGDNGFIWEEAELTAAAIPYLTATYRAQFRSIASEEIVAESEEELNPDETTEEELETTAEGLETAEDDPEDTEEDPEASKKDQEEGEESAKENHRITISYISADPEMGSVSVSSESYDPAEQDAELTGSEALPEEGYVFVNWTLNEEEVSAEPAFAPEKPEEDIEYVAHFAPEEEEAEEEEVKPEQHFSGYANGLFVRVDAPEGAFPENTGMTVTGVDSSAYLDRINNSVAELVGSARLVDITFTKDGEELQPGVPVQVSLRMGYMDSDLSCKAIHVEDDGSVSIVDGAPDGNTFAFDAEHFSEYGVIVLTQFTVISDVAEFEMQNGQAQVSAVIRPEDAPSKAVTWEIFNINGDIQGVEKKTTAAGAAVTADGVVTAQGPGTIVVRGYLTEDDTYNDLVEINVTPIMVKSITVTISGYDPTKVSSYILAGTTKQATAQITPTNAADQNLTWSSSHEGVATVDQNGLITAVREGTATITAFNEASELMGSITIRVLDRDPATATANAYQTNLYLGGIDYQIPVSQTGATINQLFDRTHVFRGTEYSFTGTVFYNNSNTTSQTNWQTMQNWTKVTAVRRYNNVNQYQDSTGWHNIGTGRLYPEYASISGDPEASENISTGVTDWGYTTNNGHFYKTLQISFYNTLTGEIILDPTGAGAKDPYGHGVIRFDNNTNNTLGGISLDDSVSDYYNKTYYVYKDTDSRSQANLQLSEATVRNYYNNRTPDAVVAGSGTASVTYNAGSNRHEHYLVLCVIAPKEIQITYTSPIEATNMPENPGKLPTLKNEGGIAVANTYTIAENVPEAEGMIFVGWAYGSHLYRGGDEITVPHKDVEFVARWIEADKVVQYAVRPGCEGMGTVSRTSEIIKENMNGSFAANNDGYHFIRWVTDPSAPDTSIGYDNQLCVPAGLTEATTFYACFERDPVVYASVLNGLLDGGTTEETHKVAYMGGQLITATPDPGCSFESISIDGTQITLVDGKASTTGLNAYNIEVDEDGDVKVTLTSITKDITVHVVYSVTAKITLTAASDEKVYDGSPLTNATVTATGLPSGFTVQATASGSATNVGDAGKNVVNDGFKILDSAGVDQTAKFTDVTKVDGKLTIKPAAVTITAQDKEFTYDGTAHSWDKYDVTGLVGSDAVTAVVTGSITLPSESPVTNKVESYSFTSGSAANYTVATENGELTMKNASVAITITAASDEWPYNGGAHQNTEVKVTSGSLLEGDELVAEASGSVTNVSDTADGNNPVKAGYKVMHGEVDVTANYVITTEAGKLTITPAAVTITAQDKEFTYNGMEQTWPEYDVTGLIGSDEIDAVVTGGITLPSESPVANVVDSYSFTSGSADNYTVATEDGELTMKNASAAITITAASDEWPYDGGAHDNTLVELTGGSLFEGDQLVAEVTGSVTNVSDTA
ncbi:MAG: Ig-like domain-containing protein, partial [Lachnospiraceae bacterium]|nr:Ig-like domain-containing protein [Lachnospiraceae bacterium]